MVNEIIQKYKKQFDLFYIITDTIYIFFYSDKYNGYYTHYRGFSIYISNTTKKEDGLMCFRDTNYTVETIPNPINIPCHLNGRYVIYYNNRTNHPLPPDYSFYAFTDLCEVEVYGNDIIFYILYMSHRVFLRSFNFWMMSQTILNHLIYDVIVHTYHKKILNKKKCCRIPLKNAWKYLFSAKVKKCIICFR